MEDFNPKNHDIVNLKLTALELFCDHYFLFNLNYVLITPVLLFRSQLISHIEEQGLGTEGLLRIPGANNRVKVC